MAELNIDSNQYIFCTDYFENNQWNYFQSQLNTAGRAIKRLAMKYGLKEARDSRWPTREIQWKKYGIKTILSVDLNGEYLDESKPNYKKEFYELYMTKIIYRWNFFYSSSSCKCLYTFNAKEIQDSDLIYQKMEFLINAKVSSN
jgi:hypothetical protein